MIHIHTIVRTLSTRPTLLQSCAIVLMAFLVVAPQVRAQSDSGGQFRIATTPDKAMITLDGKSMGQTPMAVNGVTPGEHLLMIEKAGFETIRRTLNVGPNQREVLDLELVPIMALLVIDSMPQGADVLINEASRGRTPVLITDLPLGKYRVHLSKTGYVDKDIDLNLDSRVPVKKTIDMTSNAATLVLRSEPDSVRVILNGSDRGQTPLTLDRIPSGKVTLEMTASGYKPYRQEMVLDVGQKETIRAVLTPIPGQLDIVSIPTEARIYISDQFRGTSPLSLEDFTPGTYTIRAEKEGFDPLARSVTVPRSATVVEEFRMTQISGLIEITTEPDGVSVFLDGALVGTTESGTNETDRVSSPLLINYVEEGDHTLKLTRKGFFGRDVEISIERKQTITMHHDLRRRFIPNYEVITSKGSVKGVFHEIDADGAIRLEISPGVIKTIQPDDIRLRRALRGENIPSPEETQIRSGTPKPQ